MEKIKKRLAHVVVFSLITTVFFISLNKVFLEDNPWFVFTRSIYFLSLIVFVFSLVIWFIFEMHQRL